MSGSQNSLTTPQLRGPTDGLETGEHFLGGITSTYFARGMFSGYGLCLTDQRIIGFKMQRVPLGLKVPFAALFGVLYLVVMLELWWGRAPAFPVLLLLASAAIAGISLRGVVGNRISESIFSRKATDPSNLMREKRDLELRRSEIEELLMKNPGKGLNTLRTGGLGYLKITPKDFHQGTVIEIKISRWKQYQRLRNLVIDFSSREPKVRALEYPEG